MTDIGMGSTNIYGHGLCLIPVRAEPHCDVVQYSFRVLSIVCTVASFFFVYLTHFLIKL